MTRPFHFSHLHRSFGNTIVLPDKSLAIQSDTFATPRALSGSGKFILLRNIAGLELQDQGDVHIEEHLVNGIATRNLAMVAQNYAPPPFVGETEQLLL